MIKKYIYFPFEVVESTFRKTKNNYSEILFLRHLNVIFDVGVISLSKNTN
jgi:hypothetical protein